MSEMAQTADHLIVIGRGRIIADAGTDEFINRHTAPSVRVRAVEQHRPGRGPDRSGGASVESGRTAPWPSPDWTPPPSAAPPRAHGITLIELAPLGSSLEEAYFDLTKDETDYHAGQLVGATKGA